MQVSGWNNFWKHQRDDFHAIMRVSTTFFASRLVQICSLREGKKIFDYGCGPGFLADYLASYKVLVTGADINESFLMQCKKKHPFSTFFKISAEVSENKEIMGKHISNEKFDVIVLLSISQYFKDIDELRNVISLLAPYIQTDGKIIVADVIDPLSSPLKDASALFFRCLRQRKVASFFMFIFYLLFSNYRRISAKVQLLKVSSEAIRSIANDHSLTCESIPGLTIHPTRTNYILTRN